jgi:hypothetical protein
MYLEGFYRDGLLAADELGESDEPDLDDVAAAGITVRSI